VLVTLVVLMFDTSTVTVPARNLHRFVGRSRNGWILFTVFAPSRSHDYISLEDSRFIIGANTINENSSHHSLD
jgi:hypothetical protein